VTEEYELVRPLGTGGFAKVYVGKSLSTGKDVAIKRIEMLKYVTLSSVMYAASSSDSMTDDGLHQLPKETIATDPVTKSSVLLQLYGPRGGVQGNKASDNAERCEARCIHLCSVRS
jgi:serine/threonine protein kinase